MTRTVLIGFMGAGKTTAARALSPAAVDVDTVVQERLGRPIAEVFATDGEAAFRAAETAATLELLGDPSGPPVISLGGGALGHPAVREALSGCEVVWLDIDPATAWQRAADTGRPLARDRGAFERLHAAREPQYAEAATVIVPNSRASELDADPGCARRATRRHPGAVGGHRLR